MKKLGYLAIFVGTMLSFTGKAYADESFFFEGVKVDLRPQVAINRLCSVQAMLQYATWTSFATIGAGCQLIPIKRIRLEGMMGGGSLGGGALETSIGMGVGYLGGQIDLRPILLSAQLRLIKTPFGLSVGYEGYGAYTSDPDKVWSFQVGAAVEGVGDYIWAMATGGVSWNVNPSEENLRVWNGRLWLSAHLNPLGNGYWRYFFGLKALIAFDYNPIAKNWSFKPGGKN